MPTSFSVSGPDRGAGATADMVYGRGWPQAVPGCVNCGRPKWGGGLLLAKGMPHASLLPARSVHVAGQHAVRFVCVAACLVIATYMHVLCNTRVQISQACTCMHTAA